jgi:hypothetical protein
MKYQVREKIFRLGEDNDILNEAGQPALQVDGKVLSLHGLMLVNRSIPRCVPGSGAGSRPDRPSRRLGGWREIAAGRHTLIAAPTGSGKTLAAFLVCIDRLYRQHGAEASPERAAGGVRVAAEGAGHGHPAEPGGAAAEIAAVAGELGLPARIRVAVRTGDTAARAGGHAQAPAGHPDHHPGVAVPAGHRGAEPGHAARHPDRDRGRDPRRRANKRGSHLALTLERLAHVAEGPVQRVGLSATQRPIERSRGCWSGRVRTATTRTGRRGARSWTPGTGGSSTWPWSCPTTSSARCPPASRWRRSWTGSPST